jgi:hypothetical protein
LDTSILSESDRQEFEDARLREEELKEQLRRSKTETALRNAWIRELGEIARTEAELEERKRRLNSSHTSTPAPKRTSVVHHSTVTAASRSRGKTPITDYRLVKKVMMSRTISLRMSRRKSRKKSRRMRRKKSRMMNRRISMRMSRRMIVKIRRRMSRKKSRRMSRRMKRKKSRMMSKSKIMSERMSWRMSIRI